MNSRKQMRASIVIIFAVAGLLIMLFVVYILFDSGSEKNSFPGGVAAWKPPKYEN